MREGDLAAVMRAFDRDGSKTIDYHEFHKVYLVMAYIVMAIDYKILSQVPVFTRSI